MLSVCGTLNEYGWHAFEHTTSAEELREALKRDGDFADFQDLRRSKEYGAWLRKR